MTCRLWFTVDTFPVSLGGTARTFNICQDLGLDDRYCFSPIPDLPFINFISEETCYVHEVIEAILKEAKKPKSFVNRKGLPPSSVVASFFEQANLFPNISALGLSSETVGMGTGGLMLGKLQRKTIHELLENGEELDANHLVHGAPLKVAPDSTGYPHCNAVWNTPPNSKSSEYIDTLLKYKVFNNPLTSRSMEIIIHPCAFRTTKLMSTLNTPRHCPVFEPNGIHWVVLTRQDTCNEKETNLEPFHFSERNERN